MRRVWTFDIVGGEPFDLTLPGGPACRHKGQRTIWQMVGAESRKALAESLMKELGAEVTVYGEGESDEQRAERKHLLGLDTGPQ